MTVVKASESDKETRSAQTVTLPILPEEILRIIISFTLRRPFGSNIDLEDAFDPSERLARKWEYSDPDLLDRTQLAQVSTSWRSAVAEISAEYMVFKNSRALKSTVNTLERSKKDQFRTGPHLGEWTRRIDIRFTATERLDSQAYLIRLLECTPNLLIYIYHEKRVTLGTLDARRVLETLTRHCGHSLKRIGWKSVVSPFDYRHIVTICKGFPNLVTLHLDDGDPSNGDPSTHSSREDSATLLHFPQLKTLSLRSTSSHEDATTSWDHFLHRISSDSSQLPSLECFECDYLRPNIVSFLRVHGHKILKFQTSRDPKGDASEVIESCPHLETLVIDECIGRYDLPSAHPNIQRIYLCAGVNVYSFWDPNPLGPLDAILYSITIMKAPRLREVRLRNGGIFDFALNHRSWLQSWSYQLDSRGLHFLNEMGVPYKTLYQDIQPQSVLDEWPTQSWPTFSI